MSDLIKREDAIKAMEQRYEDILRTFKRKVKVGEKAIVLDMIGCVKNLPSAYRPQGEWIKKEYNGIRYYECEKCHGEVPTNDYDYCPWCGADMRGKNDE